MRFLNRFTTLPILLDILEKRKIFIPDYSTWEDKNDIEILDYYLLKTKCQQLRVICFTHEDETIHHWNYFSKGSAGCCIQFNFDKITAHFESHGGFIHGPVSYYKISDLKNGNAPTLAKIPFSKRWPYRIENEYRFIHRSKKNTRGLEVSIDLDAIEKITFSCELPTSVCKTIKSIVSDHVEITINQSTLFKNDKWLNLIKSNATTKVNQQS